MKQKTRFIHQKFSDADLMQSSSLNWSYGTVYKLLPHAFEGENNVILLPHGQLSYGIRSGGILYNVTSPKNTVSAAVIQRCDGKACFGQTKLSPGTIVFFDDKKPYSLVTSGNFSAAIYSFSKKHYSTLGTLLLQHRFETINDTDNRFNLQLSQILKIFKTDSNAMDEQALETYEKDLIATLSSLLDAQIPLLPKLTKGEKIALEIRDRIYHRISKKVTIASLADEFGVSEQTLQNAFKSLFGFTPNRFIRHLKLNHVRKQLIEADPTENTIVKIANRWGFTHMGHFSSYYTKLFGENPSVTLKRESGAS